MTNPVLVSFLASLILSDLFCSPPFGKKSQVLMRIKNDCHNQGGLHGASFFEDVLLSYFDNEMETLWSEFLNSKLTFMYMSFQNLKQHLSLFYLV